MSAGTDGTDLEDAVGKRLRETNWVAVVVLGVASFALGFLVTGLVVVGFGQVPTGGLSGIALTVGFTLYGAHNVGIELSSGEQFQFFELVSEPAVPLLVYFAIPMVLLVGAGVLATHRFADRAVDPIQTACNVVGIAVGYLIVTVLGTVVLVTDAADGSAVSLVTSDAFLYGGVYPLVFATLGAAIESARRYLSPD